MRALAITAAGIVVIGSYLAAAAGLGFGPGAIIIGVLGIAAGAGIAATATLDAPAGARP